MRTIFAAAVALICIPVLNAAPSAGPDAPPVQGGPASDEPRIIPVGGDQRWEVERYVRGGDTLYTAGPMAVTTPLPAGYPRPTAPGAIEIKRYPSVRRAEIGMGNGPAGMYGFNSTRAFWPLFRHIKERDIAMTAPVEMQYNDMAPQLDELDESPRWTMSFLYRTPELGDTGQDGRIEVYDSEPVTVIAIGVRGAMSFDSMREYVGYLNAWLERSDEWEAAGPPRTFGYNGPDVPWRDRWHEVQVPVRNISAETAETVESPAP